MKSEIEPTYTTKPPDGVELPNSLNLPRISTSTEAKEDTQIPNSPALPAAIDSLIAIGLVVGAVLWVNAPYNAPGGVAEFLSIRVTLLNASFLVVFAMLWKQILSIFGLYQRNHKDLPGLVMRTAVACTFMTMLLGVYLEARHARGPIGEILTSFLIASLLYENGRVMVSNWELIRRGRAPEQVVIVGSGRRASKAWRELRMRHHGTKRLLGFVDDCDAAAMPPDIASRLIGKVDDLPAYLLHNTVDEVIVALPVRSCYDLAQRAVSIAETAGTRVVCLNDVFTLVQEKNLRGRTKLFVELAPKDSGQGTAETVKRTLDVMGAAVAMVVLAPVFLAIGLAIKLTSPGSIFQVQERHGFDRRSFQMFKFRSVVRIAAEQQVTPLGRFLRRTLLDQLPALWNVLAGDMSLVGPRPMSVDDVSRLGEAQRMQRFRVRPGMTGNWQVAERSSLSVEQRAALEFCYEDQWSLARDLKILARTVPAILKRSSAIQ